MNLIILPVYNEEKTIYQTIYDLSIFCIDAFGMVNFNILIINDGSTDETMKICKNMKGVRAIDNMFDKGKGSALKTGYVLSSLIYSMSDDDNIVFIDGDGQIRPQEIQVMFNVMKMYDADAVIGNKRHKYSQTEYTLARRIISQTYNAMIRLMFDFKLEDTQCGIKIFKKQALSDVIKSVTTKQYAFDLELLVALRAKRYRIADAPVTVKPQINRGSISLSAILCTFFDTIRIWIKVRKRFYSKEVLL